jgi:hypothetical protein
MTNKNQEFIVDKIILVCNGCQKERTFLINPHLYSVQELINWMKTKPTPCECGAPTCDVKAHMKEIS